jgi:hypothetical protein
MLLTKKFLLSEDEIKELHEHNEGYAWAAIDIKKHIIAVGAENIFDIKRALVNNQCLLPNIYGVGLDLETGEINYRSPINRKISNLLQDPVAPEEKREDIEREIRYFFQDLPAIKNFKEFAY